MFFCLVIVVFLVCYLLGIVVGEKDLQKDRIRTRDVVRLLIRTHIRDEGRGQF